MEGLSKQKNHKIELQFTHNGSFCRVIFHRTGRPSTIPLGIKAAVIRVLDQRQVVAIPKARF